jgi:dTDP-4-dehydrorhamnose reductase
MDLSKQKILVTGALGMLAADVVPQLKAKGATLILSDIREGEREDFPIVSLDISRLEEVIAFFSSERPDIVVNCAAYTRVDDAETDFATAFSVNADSVANLAKAARLYSAKVVHVSSDYVFGGGDPEGERRQEYREDEQHAPCGLYGFSKHYGDELLRGILPEQHLIVRTSWLHGIAGPNFIDTMLRVGKERDTLRVVNDQFGSPTWSCWLAEMICSLIEKQACGTFHASSTGTISWYDLAVEIFAQASYTTKVEPQTTEELGRPAPRPAFSSLSKDKLHATLGDVCIDWKESVAAHLRARGVV